MKGPSSTTTAWCGRRTIAWNSATASNPKLPITWPPWPPSPGRRPPTGPVDPELLAHLQERGDVVKVNETVVFTTAAYEDMAGRIVEHLNANGSVTVADARTIFGTSRKYVLPLLEYLDQQRITRRVGDERVLR